MAALIISELMNWNSGFGRRALSVFIGCSVLTGILTKLHPELYLGGMVLIFVGIGLWTGKQISNNVPVAIWIHQANLRPWQIVFGEIFAAGCISLIHLAALLPVAILIIYVWGITWVMIGLVSLILFMVAGISAGFGILIEKINWHKPFLLILTVFSWLGLTLIPPFQVLNPCCWVEWALNMSTGIKIFYIPAFSLALILGIILLTGALMRWEAGKAHDG